MANTSNRYKWVSAVLACFLYGGWAYYINSGSHPLDGLASGIVQGISSFFLTFSIVVAVTKIYNRSLFSGVLSVLMPAVVTVGGVAVVLTLIHFVIGTSHIFPTILPSVLVASVFCIVTAKKLEMAS